MQISTLALFVLAAVATVSAAPATPKSARAAKTNYTLDIQLLDLTVASESCIDVPSSGTDSIEQYIAGLDCTKTGDSGKEKSYSCALTGNTTGALGAILGGVSSACSSASGTPNGGQLL